MHVCMYEREREREKGRVGTNRGRVTLLPLLCVCACVCVRVCFCLASLRVYVSRYIWMRTMSLNRDIHGAIGMYMGQ